MKEKLSADERLFTFEDLKFVYRKNKGQLFRASVYGAICISCLVLLSPVKYKLNALFKESAEKGDSGANLMKELVIGISPSSNLSQAAILMQSNEVLKSMIEEEGLQIKEQRPGTVFRAFRRIYENLRAEMGLPLNDFNLFRFENVSYEGEKQLHFTLFFSDENQFTLSDELGTKVDGKIGIPVSIQRISFTLAKVPESLSLKKKYRFTCSPWTNISEEIRRSLAMSREKVNNFLVNLTFKTRDREEGVRILNGIMKHYRNYLKKNHDAITSQQIAYLEEKQQEIYEKLGIAFDEHAEYLKDTVEKNGFFAVKQEINSLVKPYSQLLEKMRALDLELACLQKGEHPELLNQTSPFGLQIAKILEKVNLLERERDLLGVSLIAKGHSRDWGTFSDELQAIRQEKEEIDAYISTIQKGGNFASLPRFSWSSQLHPNFSERELFPYLSNRSHLLSIRQKLLSERISYSGSLHHEFEGIDPATGRLLFKSYANKLDAAQEKATRYARLRNELEDPSFDLASLGSLLEDSVSQEIIQSGVKIKERLKDERYLTDKEGGRWVEELAFQRALLKDHLEQLQKVEELSCAFIQDKIASVQQVTLDSLNQKISIAREQIQDLLKQRKETVLEEKGLIGIQLEEIRKKSLDVPDRWKMEHLLELKSRLGAKIMSVMTELVESKSVGSHLHHVESKPVDLAIAPYLPEKPFLIPFACVGASVAFLGAYLKEFVKRLKRGFPATEKKLKMIQLPCSGKLSSFCDGPSTESIDGDDLKTLRQISLFLDHAKTVVLIGRKTRDFSYSLAQNIARASKRSVIVRADFTPKFSPKDRPGLLQWLKGEIDEIPIRRENGYEVIPSGGFSAFGAEFLQSNKLTQLIEQLKLSYDIVFIWAPVAVDSPEREILLRIADKAIVAIEEESIEELTEVLDWAYHEGKYRLTFVCAE